MEVCKTIEDYLIILKAQISCKKAKEFVAEEVKSHLEDQKTVYLLEGISEKEAEEKAIIDMGDPVTIGLSLNQVHRPKMNWFLLGLIFTFSLVGVIIQSSLSVIERSQVSTENMIYTMLVGFFIMLVFCFFDYSLIGKIPRSLWIGITILFLILNIFVGREVNGSTVFLLPSFPISFLLLFYIPLFGGIIYSFRGKGYYGLTGCVLFYLIPIVIASDSKSRAIEICLSCTILLLMACFWDWFKIGKKKSVKFCLILVVCIFISWSFLFIGQYPVWWKHIFFSTESSYQSEVIKEFLSHVKWIGEVKIALPELTGNADLFTITSGILPDLRENYILTYIICRFGILPVLFICLLFCMFIAKGLHLSLTQNNHLGKLIGVGCTLSLAISGFFYLLSNLGFQVIRQGLFPFISYGRGGAIICYCIIGILLSIFRHSNIIKEVPYVNNIKLKREHKKITIEL